MKAFNYLWRIIVLGAITCGVLLILWIALIDIVDKAERDTATEQLTLVKQYISKEAQKVEKMAVKYSENTNVISMVRSNKQKSKKRFLRSSTLKKSKPEFVYILNRNGKVLLSKSYDIVKNQFKKINQKVSYQLHKDEMMKYIQSEDIKNGIIYSNGLYVFGSAPVFVNPDSERVLGYIVIGRIIDVRQASLFASIKIDLLEVNLALNPQQNQLLKKHEVSDVIHLKSLSNFQSTLVVKNQLNYPVAFIKIDRKSRDVLALLKVSWLSVVMLLGIAILLGYAYWWSYKNKFKSDIKKLEMDIQNIRVGAELSGRISNDGRSILTGVVNQINQKIGGFEKSFDDFQVVHRKHDAEILLNELPMEAYLKDIDLKYVTVNEKFCNSIDIESDLIIGKKDSELSFVNNIELILKKELDVINKKVPVEFEEIIKDSNGAEKVYSTHLIPFINNKGIVEGVVGVKINIDDIKRADAEMEMASKVLENTAEGVMVTNDERRVIHVNSAYSGMTGYSEEELLGKIPLLLQKESRSKTYQEIQQSLEQQGNWKGELWSSRKDGSNYPEMVNIKVIRNKEGDITNYFSMSNDFTEQKQWQDKLYQMAHYDPLTGLPNRTLFKDRLHQEIIRSQRNKKNFGVLFFDIDLFKSINDSLGHAAGDELLKVVGHRLGMALRNADSIARLGGDEFVILVTDLAKDHKKNVGYLTSLCDKVIDVVNQPFEIEGKEISVTCSIGVTVFPKDASNSEDLLRNADSAMYYAKSNGRRNYQFYSKEFNERAVERFETEIELRLALKEGSLEVHYQPQIDVISRHVVGAEALLRWKKDGRNVLGPEKIIELAEETGMIYELGNWILKTACIECKKWADQGHKNLRVAVNLSARQFRQKDLVQIVENILKETGLQGKLLELEVTESALMENVEYSIEMMAELSRKGVRWSLDDFGTGYSSLTYLRDFPVHVLKVDQSFVREITISPEDAAIVETIIDLAHRLHLTVIAEGVETEDQLKVLSRMNCEQIQGYYFSKPKTPLEFDEYISNGVRV